ncbi:MAG: response regulator [Verrucomicrobiales bacterium]|nr:response regulator [Verrucomicrobiales bacterium]HQW29111.1 response regulator [Verrucomicrobiales bacterium]
MSLSSAPPLSTSQVLILDDFECIRKLLARFLNHYGIATLATGSEAEAFKLLQRPEVKVLIQDFTREGGTRGGFRFLQWMRSGEATRHIPVVIVSGTSVGKIKRAFAESRLSMDEELLGFWPKPLDCCVIAEIIKTIREHVDLD